MEQNYYDVQEYGFTFTVLVLRKLSRDQTNRKMYESLSIK